MCETVGCSTKEIGEQKLESENAPTHRVRRERNSRQWVSDFRRLGCVCGQSEPV